MTLNQRTAKLTLRNATLAEARRSGTVRNLRDRRFDLYRIVWTDRG